MYRLTTSPSMSKLSTMYIRVSVTATDQGQPVDPTANPVSFAFTQDSIAPTEDDWVSGSWETAGYEYLARCLVGPEGSVALDKGNYTVWLKITLAPETIIEAVGDLFIYFKEGTEE